jgi:hypothetical protein
MTESIPYNKSAFEAFVADIDKIKIYVDEIYAYSSGTENLSYETLRLAERIINIIFQHQGQEDKPACLSKYLLNAGLLQKYYHKEFLMHHEPYRVFVKKFAKNNV